MNHNPKVESLSLTESMNDKASLGSLIGHATSYKRREKQPTTRQIYKSQRINH